MAFLRFPIPEFDFNQFKDLSWAAPSYLSQSDIDGLISAQQSGDASSYGAYAVETNDAVLEKFNIRGEHAHAVLCVLPEGDVHVIGRSYAWWKQRVVVTNSLDAGDLEVAFDWNTPRPMNNRLGPDDGMTIKGGVYYALAAHRYDDHWIANRTLEDNEWDGGDASNGFRMLAASKDDANEFCEICLSFTWNE